MIIFFSCYFQAKKCYYQHGLLPMDLKLWCRHLVSCKKNFFYQTDCSFSYHEWSRGYRANFYANETIRKKGIQWIQDILNEKIQDPVYGLGKIRTIQEYFDYAGVDFKKRIFTRPLGTPFMPPSSFKPLPPYVENK